MRFRTQSALAVILSMLFSMACATGSGQIKAPQSAYTDPSMDFQKIGTVAILPIFPEKIEDQNFSGAFGRQFEAALTTSQRQWRLIGSREVLQAINSNGLGNGYKNLQADYNSPSSGMGQVVFSPSTNAFIRDLKRVLGADAFIVGTYSVPEQPLGNGLMANLLMPATLLGEGTKIKVSLLYSNGPSLENWWSASVTRRRINEKVLAEMAASLASNMGKGTYLQL